MTGFADRLAAARIIAIVRDPDVATTGPATARRLFAAGVRAIELTLDQPGAVDAIATVRAEAPAEVLVGGGTVTTPAQVADLVAAGAEFAVAPGLDPDVVDAAHARDLPIVPGVMTATEVSTALRRGADVLKLFPAGPLGVDYLSALAKPFTAARFVPTGGIALADVDAWIDAGALCVGVGGALTDSATSHADLAAALGVKP